MYWSEEKRLLCRLASRQMIDDALTNGFAKVDAADVIRAIVHPSPETGHPDVVGEIIEVATIGGEEMGEDRAGGTGHGAVCRWI